MPTSWTVTNRRMHLYRRKVCARRKFRFDFYNLQLNGCYERFIIYNDIVIGGIDCIFAVGDCNKKSFTRDIKYRRFNFLLDLCKNLK